MHWCFHGVEGRIVQGLPLPQPEGGRRLIVLTVAEQPWASRRQRSYCGNLESVDIIINLSRLKAENYTKVRGF